MHARRFTIVSKKYTQWQRFKIWARRVWFSISEPIPSEYNAYKSVSPDDPSYKDAPFEEYVESGTIGGIFVKK